MRMSSFDWPHAWLNTRYTGVCSVIRFERSRNDDSKTLHVLDEVLLTACMPVHEFIQLWRTEYYAKNLHVCLIFITMTFQIYKSWSLLDSNSTKTRTGACITQNHSEGWRRRKLNHKHSHSP